METINWSKIAVIDIIADGKQVDSPVLKGDGHLQEFHYKGRKIVLDRAEHKLLVVLNPEEKKIEFLEPGFAQFMRHMGIPGAEWLLTGEQPDWRKVTATDVAAHGEPCGVILGGEEHRLQGYAYLGKLVVLSHAHNDIVLVTDPTTGSVEYHSPKLKDAEVVFKRIDRPEVFTAPGVVN